MNPTVKSKLLSYVEQLKVVKDTGIQRVTSASSNDNLNVCLIKDPEKWINNDNVSYRETNIKCPLCRRLTASLLVPTNYWQSTEITCSKCGLHVSDWNAHDDRKKSVKYMWKSIEHLSLRQIVPFGLSWFKSEEKNNK